MIWDKTRKEESLKISRQESNSTNDLSEFDEDPIFIQEMTDMLGKEGTVLYWIF